MKWRRFINLVFISLLSAVCLDTASAQPYGSIQVRSFKLTAVDAGFSVDIDSTIELNPTLEQALEKGIVLYFVNKFTLVEPRWYWFDKEVARIKTRVGLRYHALTRRYILSDNTFSRNYSTLKDALVALQRLRDHPLTIYHELKPNVQYNATLRLWLDLTRMPKPFQVEALGSSAWNLSSDRLEWQMTLPKPDQPFQLSIEQ
ncbi:MAG: DUF4390 domain-containing protein [Burkholderiales bacterium]|uniref:DUF4390 domain-containing protein n=1 Tax=Nitrosomonas sp. TaxID=42353 RepID=UPI001D644CE9|nr:DUF4390 domain-containing protein [Nitrosomonas sp.]MCB1947766.1 DUF4390 domain-containing protein [Nitrosomonas sp.]MCP5243612.1 DUF4390 domain-containing protein [Burkholderiales bacterium]